MPYFASRSSPKQARSAELRPKLAPNVRRGDSQKAALFPVASRQEFIGHFLLRLTELSRTHLAFEIAGKSHTQVDISFELNAAEFKEVRGVAEVIFGLREPDYGDDDKAH